jgi:archaellum component FlaC
MSEKLEETIEKLRLCILRIDKAVKALAADVAQNKNTLGGISHLLDDVAETVKELEDKVKTLEEDHMP